MTKILDPKVDRALKDMALAKSQKDLKHFTARKVQTFATAPEIRNARKRAGESQREFSLTLGVTLRQYQSWEQDWRLCPLWASKMIRLIAKNPSFARTLKAA